MKCFFGFIFISALAFGQTPIICDDADCIAPLCENVKATLDPYDGDVISEDYTGSNKSCYENGKLKELINYVNGKKHGAVLIYYESGQLKYRSHFVNDLEDGLAMRYHENGNLSDIVNFFQGQMDGELMSFFEDGTLDY